MYKSLHRNNGKWQETLANMDMKLYEKGDRKLSTVIYL